MAFGRVLGSCPAGPSKLHRLALMWQNLMSRNFRLQKNWTPPKEQYLYVETSKRAIADPTFGTDLINQNGSLISRSKGT